MKKFIVVINDGNVVCITDDIKQAESERRGSGSIEEYSCQPAVFIFDAWKYDADEILLLTREDCEHLSSEDSSCVKKFNGSIEDAINEEGWSFVSSFVRYFPF